MICETYWALSSDVSLPKLFSMVVSGDQSGGTSYLDRANFVVDFHGCLLALKQEEWTPGGSPAPALKKTRTTKGQAVPMVIPAPHRPTQSLNHKHAHTRTNHHTHTCPDMQGAPVEVSLGELADRLGEYFTAESYTPATLANYMWFVSALGPDGMHLVEHVHNIISRDVYALLPKSALVGSAFDGKLDDILPTNGAFLPTKRKAYKPTHTKGGVLSRHALGLENGHILAAGYGLNLVKYGGRIPLSKTEWANLDPKQDILGSQDLVQKSLIIQIEDYNFVQQMRISHQEEQKNPAFFLQHASYYNMLEVLAFARKRQSLAEEVSKWTTLHPADSMRLGSIDGKPVFTNIQGYGTEDAMLDRCASCKGVKEISSDRCCKCMFPLHSRFNGFASGLQGCITLIDERTYCVHCAAVEVLTTAVRANDIGNEVQERLLTQANTDMDTSAAAVKGAQHSQSSAQTRLDAAGKALKEHSAVVEQYNKEREGVLRRLESIAKPVDESWIMNSVYSSYDKTLVVPEDRRAPNGRIKLKAGDSFCFYPDGGNVTFEDLNMGQITRIHNVRGWKENKTANNNKQVQATHHHPHNTTPSPHQT